MKLQRIRRMAGISLLLAVLAATITGLIWTPYDPLQIHFADRLQPPSFKFLLGTDEYGRDELSRLLAGAATSIQVSALTAFFAVTVGGAIGLLIGYVRGWTDRIVMSFVSALLAFPGLLLALSLSTVMGAGQYSIVFALGVAYMPSIVRIVRGIVLSLREKEFIESSKVLGNSGFYTAVRHVIPNFVGPLLVVATSMLGWVILAESALSFLGLGVPPPAPTWGNMLASARPFITQSTYLSILPGACIAVTLLAINLVGDELRDLLDPRTRKYK